MDIRRGGATAACTCKLPGSIERARIGELEKRARKSFGIDFQLSPFSLPPLFPTISAKRPIRQFFKNILRVRLVYTLRFDRSN